MVCLLSFFGATKAPLIPVNLGLDKLLPDHSESVVEMNEISDDIGGVGHLNILIGPMEHPEQYLELIAKKIQTHPDVKYVVYHNEYHALKDKLLFILDKNEFSKLRKNARTLFNKGSKGLLNLGLEDESDLENNLEEAKTFFKKFKNDYENDEYFLSKDKKYALMMVKPTFESVDLDRSELFTTALSTEIEEILQGRHYHLMGRYVEKVNDTKQIKGDIKMTGMISTVLIVLGLIFGLGSFRSALFVAIGVAMALGLTSGIAYYLVGQINILTGFLIAILSGLGADYGIHLIRRFYQEIENGMTRKEALYHTYMTTGRALFSSAFSTATAFLCLVVSDFRGFSELGIIAGFGILSVLAVFLLTFPVMGQLLRPNIRFVKTAAIPNYFPFKLSHLKYLVFIIPFILYGAFHAQFEYNFNRMRNLSDQTMKLENLVDELYGKSTSPVGILATGNTHAQEIVDFVNQDKYKLIVKKVVSLSTLLPEDMESRFRKIKKLVNLLDGVSDAEIEEKTGLKASDVRAWLNTNTYSKEDLPFYLVNSFGKSGNIVLLYPTKNIDNKTALYEMADLLKDIKKEFPQSKIGSDTLVFAEILEHIITDGKYIVLIFLFGVFVTFLIDNRSFKSAFILETQVIVGIFFLVGLMGLFGVRFTIINVAIFPAVLAIGIDMGVHILHREKEGWPSLMSAQLSANAVQISLITTLIGFGSLLLTQAKILQDIGLLAVLGIMGMYLVCMVFRPLIKDSRLKSSTT